MDDCPTVNNNFKYYELSEHKTLSEQLQSSWSYFHTNCPGIVAYWANFNSLIRNIYTETFAFDFIELGEV